MLSYSTNALTIAANVNLVSAGAMTLSGATAAVTTPTHWNATDSILLLSPIGVTNDDVMVVRSDTSITIANNITSTGTVEFQANQDCSGIGSVTIQSDSIVSASTLNILGSQINILDENCYDFFQVETLLYWDYFTLEVEY